MAMSFPISSISPKQIREGFFNALPSENVLWEKEKLLMFTVPEKERGIGLNHQVLREKDINGRRVLYCSQKDFPNQSREEVGEAVDALQAIHEEHL